jgi:putative addiction module component (TIGR02574 family)
MRGVMSRDFKDIVAEVLDLPLTARAELASELLDSLDDLSEKETEQLWAEEAERRFGEYKAGRMDAISAEEVFARLRSRNK